MKYDFVLYAKDGEIITKFFGIELVDYPLQLTLTKAECIAHILISPSQEGS